MATRIFSDASERDWRLTAKLDVADARRSLDHLIRHVRTHEIVNEVQATVSDDVVITHDGRLLFAYASTEATLRVARSAIEGVLRHDGLTASVYLSHWDDKLADWRQTDPPLSAKEKRIQFAADQDAEAIETRTLIASLGKLIRAEFEQSMLQWADSLGVDCKIFEHPHLLTTQVAFTVTGPKRRIEEFSKGLAAEERSTIRADTVVMLSPL
jgi:hypothetical protein